jgi:hypothetical protein
LKDRIYKIVRNAAGKLRKELPPKTRLFIFFLEPFSQEMQVCWPLNDVPEVTQATDVLVQTCMKRERSIVVHDAETDVLLKGIAIPHFSAAACTPLFDPEGIAMGVIYADHIKAGMLEKEQRLLLERLAREQKKRIPRWTIASKVPTKKVAAKETWYDPKVAMVSLLVFAFFGIAWIFAPADSPKGPGTGGASPIAKRIQEPQDIVRTQLSLLSLRQYHQVYQMLDTESQAAVSEEEMTKRVTEWFSDEGNRWEFGRRVIRPGPAESKSVIVYVEPGVNKDELETWDYELVLEDKEWCIRGVSGGPLAPKS